MNTRGRYHFTDYKTTNNKQQQHLHLYCILNNFTRAASNFLDYSVSHAEFAPTEVYYSFVLASIPIASVLSESESNSSKTPPTLDWMHRLWHTFQRFASKEQEESVSVPVLKTSSESTPTSIISTSSSFSWMRLRQNTSKWTELVFQWVHSHFHRKYELSCYNGLSTDAVSKYELNNHIIQTTPLVIIAHSNAAHFGGVFENGARSRYIHTTLTELPELRENPFYQVCVLDDDTKARPQQSPTPSSSSLWLSLPLSSLDFTKSVLSLAHTPQYINSIPLNHIEFDRLIFLLHTTKKSIKKTNDMCLPRRVDMEKLAVTWDDETWFNKGSVDSIGGSVRAVLHAVHLIWTGERRHVFLAGKPGHHAASFGMMGDNGNGFGFFNYVAIAYRLIRLLRPNWKILMLDHTDIHMGNGTQEILANESVSLFRMYDIHRAPNQQEIKEKNCRPYPRDSSSSAPSSIQSNNGCCLPQKGSVTNVHLNRMYTGQSVLTVWNDLILPDLEAFGFKPDLVIMSVGFDSRRNDPCGAVVGGAQISPHEFFQIAQEVRSLGVPTISVCEGGYAGNEYTDSVAQSLGECLIAFIRGLSHSVEENPAATTHNRQSSIANQLNKKQKLGLFDSWMHPIHPTDPAIDVIAQIKNERLKYQQLNTKDQQKQKQQNEQNPIHARRRPTESEQIVSAFDDLNVRLRSDHLCCLQEHINSHEDDETSVTPEKFKKFIWVSEELISVCVDLSVNASAPPPLLPSDVESSDESSSSSDEQGDEDVSHECFLRTLAQSPESINCDLLKNTRSLVDFKQFKERVSEYFPHFVETFIQPMKTVVNQQQQQQQQSMETMSPFTQLYFPFNYDNKHWIAILMDFTTRELILLDSAPNMSKTCIQVQILAQHSKSYKHTENNDVLFKTALPLIKIQTRGQRVLQIFELIASYLLKWIGLSSETWAWTHILDYERPQQKQNGRIMPEQRGNIVCGDMVGLIGWQLSQATVRFGASNFISPLSRGLTLDFAVRELNQKPYKEIQRLIRIQRLFLKSKMAKKAK